MQLTSNVFADQSPIPAAYTCKGQNINPPLHVNDAPATAQSLTLILHDPDAPMGDFTHWLLWNISPKLTDIAEDSIPVGAIQGVTDFRNVGYGGPCPPAGTHRYIFDLYALDVALDLPQGTSRAELEAAMQGHIVGTAQLTGLVSA